ncbi:MULTISPECIES: hypothetical protein [unclassified Sphingopyxis]|jgi:hypothetical protein|uniref:hypothetical protein n=1 Tax=unclassified Sphingopyxis TaxID=2614943 RepID=UPI0025E98F1C|nr:MULTISPECIES: hypothetical protein [unclassified Sphingopyxis]
MPTNYKRPLSIALGAIATTLLGGCYGGGVYGASYASGGDCAARYGNAYYDYDGYAYDDGYGYDCYDASDYGSGFINIGFGGGWYDDYYYPGYGTWMFDRYRNRYPLRDQYLNYWGGRRAWWKHHGSRGHGQPGRPGGWNRGDRDNAGPRGTRPGRGRGDDATATPPVNANPERPGRPGRPDWGTARPRPVPQGDGADGRPRTDRPRTDRPSGWLPRSDTAPPRTGTEIRRIPRSAPSAMPERAPRADRPAPAVRQPPAARQAPPVQSAPPPAPTERVSGGRRFSAGQPE